MPREMLINMVEGRECRIAILAEGLIEELYVERSSSASHVGNIYKGRVTNVEPSIQAAFVDFGLDKNGFLHISDIHPKHFPKGQKGSEVVGRKRARRDRPPIQECLKRGQEVVVQLTKEGIGTKGPTLTTYLSIPGRLLVMMPGMSRLGVSRKIEDEDARLKARTLLADLKVPSEMGFIVRTAGTDRNKRDFQRDLNYLTRLWQTVNERIKASKAPAEIYQESDLVSRTIRDVYNSDITRIICDEESVARKVREFLAVAMPRTKCDIQLYMGKEGLFYEYGLEHEIEKMYSRKVDLPSGGSLVIDQAEALVAIDVNSGRFREHRDAETTALKLNVEAAKEITRQLRLRDLGGVVVMDFVDMRLEKNRRAVEKTLREQIKHDRAKTKALRMSSFGIIEMTRQRVRPSLRQGIYETCPHCAGAAVVKSDESQALLVMRALRRAASNDQVVAIEVRVSPTVADYLSNSERRRISDMEVRTGRTIRICADAELGADEVRLICTNQRGSEIALSDEPPAGRSKQEVEAVGIDQLPAARPAEGDAQAGPAGPAAAGDEAGPIAKKSKRRGRRGGRKHKRKSAPAGEQPEQDSGKLPAEAEKQRGAQDQPTEQKKPRRRRRSRKKTSSGEPADQQSRTPDQAGPSA